jgi:multimeric flavodoxin WrbA
MVPLIPLPTGWGTATRRRKCMKIVAVNGSPRGMRGATGRLLQEVIAGATGAGAEVETICLSQTPLIPCVACDACHRKGVCPLKDDYEQMREKLEGSDAVIYASPNYIFSVTAQMKAFFDRCNGLAHRTAFEGKYAVLVETSGGGGDEEVLNYMQGVVNALGAQCVGRIGSTAGGPNMFPDQEALFQQARALGSDLVAAVREKREYPEQAEGRLAFRAKMQDLISMMGEYWPYEREYWANR